MINHFGDMIKGKTNNPNGRPAGTPNKVTTDLKAFITEIIEQSREAIKSDLLTLEPYQRLIILERLMRFVVAPEKTTQSIEILPERPVTLIRFVGLDGEDNDYIKYDHSQSITED